MWVTTPDKYLSARFCTNLLGRMHLDDGHKKAVVYPPSSATCGYLLRLGILGPRRFAIYVLELFEEFCIVLGPFRR